ncbi:hypothetical protein [Jeotgalibacillus aurantiacus]|nr:hypothetical protein [Jeotgalibacillus aurantiacus]
MNDRLLDYIKELEIIVLNSGKKLPVMREDLLDLLYYEADPE